MNEEQKDKGLKKAMKEQPQFRLPTNFTFHTMQKVEEAIVLREKKQERRTLWATILASLFLLAMGIGGLLVYMGDGVKETLRNLFRESTFSGAFTPVYGCFIVSILLLMTFDRWMRKRYYHSKQGEE